MRTTIIIQRCDRSTTRPAGVGVICWGKVPTNSFINEPDMPGPEDSDQVVTRAAKTGRSPATGSGQTRSCRFVPGRPGHATRPWDTPTAPSSSICRLQFGLIPTASNEFGIVADSSDSAVLAYAITWRRDTIGQTLGKGPDRQACHCAFFVPVDTFYITKDVYLDSLGANVFIRRDKNPNEQDYREYFFPFRFPNDTLMRSTTSDTLALIPLDTTITINGLNYSSIPVYGDCIATDSNGDCIEWGTRPYKPSDRDFGGGARFGEDTTWRGRYCDRLLDTLIARGVYPNVDSLAGRTIPFKNDFVLGVPHDKPCAD